VREHSSSRRIGNSNHLSRPSRFASPAIGRAQTWSSQDSVGTPPLGLVSRFEPIGAHAAEVAVTANWIVEGLDVVGYVCTWHIASTLN